MAYSIYDGMSEECAAKAREFFARKVERKEARTYQIIDAFRASQIEREYQRSLFNPHYDTYLNRAES